MSVWDDEHPKPAADKAEYERSLLGWITDDSEKQMAALVPGDGRSLARYRQIVGGAIDVMIGRGLSEIRAEVTRVKSEDQRDFRLVALLLGNPAASEEVPAFLFAPKTRRNGEAVVWIDKLGKQALFDRTGAPKPAVQTLLSAGFVVVGVDLFGQGEATADGKPLTKARLDDRGRGNLGKYAGYTFGYNHPVFSKRVHDVLTVISAARNAQTPPKKVHLVGLAGAGHWVAAARAQAGDAVDRAAVDTAGFRFAELTACDDPDFLPGGAKYHDLPGMLALSAPQDLWLAGEGAEAPPVVTAAYHAAGDPERLTVFAGKKQEQEAAAVEWLLR